MAKHSKSNSMNRREFLRRVSAFGGAAALAAFLESCSKAGLIPETRSAPTERSSIPTASTTAVPDPTREPTPTQPAPSDTPTAAPSGRARIAFVKTDNRAEGVRRAVELLGASPVSDRTVFLKANFNSADPTPGSTHPQVLAALVTLLKEQGARQITVGDRSGMGNTRAVMEQLGVFKLAGELGFDALVFDDLSAEDWVLFKPEGSHWRDGFAVARPALEADTIVQTCCLKTHRYGGHFTLSLKNSVGLVAQSHPETGRDLMQELHGSQHQRRMIAEINTAYTPSLVVLDGVDAFISGGPDTGEKVSPQVVLAGTDRVAVDAVGIALLRFFGCNTEAAQGKIFDQQQIARAVELGLGVDRPEKIDFVTGDTDSAAYSASIQELLLAG